MALVALLPSPEAVAAGSGGEALRADVRRIAHAARAWTEARAGSGPEVARLRPMHHAGPSARPIECETTRRQSE